MVAVGPFSIDMYLPAFGTIANDLGTTISKVSLSMGSYFVGMALGQILYGPLLDRFGRKPPLYLGLAAYLAATVACILAANVNELIVYRFIQAVGGCATSVAAFAMVRDIFPVKDNAKIFSSLMLVISASPLFAPYVGAEAIALWGWQSVFVILIGVTILITLLIFFFMPESKGADPTFSLRARDIIGTYKTVFSEPQFFTYAFSGGIAFSGLFAFIGNSPFLYNEIYGLTPKQYGQMFAFLVGGLILAGQANRLLLRKFSSETLIAWAISIQVLAAVVLMIRELMDLHTFYSQTGLIWVYLATVGIVLPNSSALTLAPFSSNTGTASSGLGVLQLGFGAIASITVGLTTTTSSAPMTIAMLACSLLAMAGLVVGKRFMKVSHSSSASPSLPH